MSLVVENLTKRFGEKTAVDHISFSMETPGVFGLLGTNGAGKTTTIRTILGIMEADEGKAQWNGRKINRETLAFGYLPEERGIYMKTKVLEQLIYFGMLRGMKREAAKKSALSYMERLGVMEYKNMPAEKLSKGNQQKVQLAQTLMCDPDIVILDEPFSGLDPVNSQTLKEVVQEQIQDGKLVIFSSHQMNYVEEFCEDIVILHHGDVVLQGNLKQIKKEYGKNRIVIRALYPKKQEFRELLETQCQELLHIYEEKDGGFIIELQPNVNKRDVLTRMLELEVDLEAFQLYEASLTDIFVSKAGDEE